MMSALDSFSKFCRKSAKIGRDITLIQATGGNTSLKQGDRLWIKASGTALADAEIKSIFVSLDLPATLNALTSDVDSALGRFVMSGEGLRPSIETPLHALLPHSVVLHVHSVAVLAWACRVDGQTALMSRLSGLNWAWIPYARPGGALVEAVKNRLPEKPDILVLANHGLVVAGNDVDIAFALLHEVERRLALPIRSAPPANAERLMKAAQATGYEPALDAEAHAIALVAERRAIAERGSLYPDHVVFLGAPVVWREAHAVSGSPSWLIIPDAGVLLKPCLSTSAREMLRCLGLVLERIESDVPLAWLTCEDEAELLSWDAEKYRQQLSRQTVGDTEIGM
ncbi:Aldolase [Azospirillaceae bacterium]